MKKGYVFVVFFALCITIFQTFKYGIVLKEDTSQITASFVILKIIAGFILFVIPGLLLARWYYKKKD
jgi:hypothetical protein